MYICKNCNEVLFVDELKRVKGEWIDCRYGGEHVGFQYEGDDYVCPHCGSEELQEAVQCPICGEYVAEEESYDGYCENCVEKAATPENLIEWSEYEKDTDTVEINESLLAMCKALKIDIEAVLKAAINESAYKDKLNAYCKMTAKEEIDTEYFMKWFTERG